MNNTSALKGILVLIAVLLAANLIATFLRPAADQPAVAFLPTAQANSVLRLEGPVLVTTNEAGDRLTIWQLGRVVNDRYEAPISQTFAASGMR